MLSTASALPKPTYALELDAYYSDFYVDIPLRKDTAPVKFDSGELSTYFNMMREALVPSFLTLEASINPLPLAGVGIRRHANDFYWNSQISPSLNLVETVTAGFEEPYALSLFLGRVINFDQDQRTMGKRKKKGYVGFLVSAGDRHLFQSQSFRDRWVELEWKVKGDLQTEARKMSWSFRIGSKLHSNGDIADIYYIGIRRGRIDYEKTPLSFLLSSDIEYRLDVDRRNFGSITNYLMLEKNFSLPKRKAAVSLGFGYLWRSPNKYSGALAGSADQSTAQILFRPNIKF